MTYEELLMHLRCDFFFRSLIPSLSVIMSWFWQNSIYLYYICLGIHLYPSIIRKRRYLEPILSWVIQSSSFSLFFFNVATFLFSLIVGLESAFYSVNFPGNSRKSSMMYFCRRRWNRYIGMRSWSRLCCLRAYSYFEFRTRKQLQFMYVLLSHC